MSVKNILIHSWRYTAIVAIDLSSYNR